MTFHRNSSQHICPCASSEQELAFGLVFLWFCLREVYCHSRWKPSLFHGSGLGRLLIFKGFYGNRLKLSNCIFPIKTCIKCIMKGNVPVQDQNWSILCVCVKNLSLSFPPSWGLGRNLWSREVLLFATTSTQDSWSLQESENNPRASACRNISEVIYTLVHLHPIYQLSFAMFYIFHFSCCTVSLGNTLRNTSPPLLHSMCSVRSFLS